MSTETRPITDSKTSNYGLAPIHPEQDSAITIAPAAAVSSAVPAVSLTNLSVDQMMRLGEVLAASRYFKDAGQTAQCIVKMLYGAELGVGPISSMMGIHIIEGKPSPSANLLAAVVRRSRRYDYRIAERTDERCEIIFTDRGQEVGRSCWTMKDAARAGLAGKDVWKKYPRAMLFSRAMSEGARVYCPELFGGAPVYTPEELGAEINPESGEPVALPPPPVQDLAYWRRRAMALYTELGGVPSERDACRADLAGILGIEPTSRTQLTAEQWRRCAEHMEQQLRQPEPAPEEEQDADPFIDAAREAVEGAEAGTYRGLIT